MLNYHGSILNSGEGSSERKRLVINVKCQSHSILQSQAKADLHNWRCTEQNLSTLKLIQQQSRATLSRDPATASFRSHLLAARAIPLLSSR